MPPLDLSLSIRPPGTPRTEKKQCVDKNSSQEIQTNSLHTVVDTSLSLRPPGSLNNSSQEMHTNSLRTVPQPSRPNAVEIHLREMLQQRRTSGTPDNFAPMNPSDQRHEASSSRSRFVAESEPSSAKRSRLQVDSQSFPELNGTSDMSINPEEKWDDHRNALAYKLRNHDKKTYTYAKLNKLTFSELDAFSTSMPKDIQQTILRWKKEWKKLPDSDSKKNGNVFLQINGSIMTRPAIQALQNRHINRQAVLEHGLRPLPLNWVAHRKALVVELAKTGCTIKYMAKLTFKTLENNKDLISSLPPGIFEAWKKDWEEFPKGTGIKDGLIFICQSGNKMNPCHIEDLLK